MTNKGLITAVFSLFITGAVMAQASVTISGTITKKRNEVKLFKVAAGKTIAIATAVPTGNGKFGFLFYPEYEGLYVIGTGNSNNPNENYKFYFKGGEQLNLNITGNSYELAGKLNSKENVVLTQWHDLANAVEQKAINFMQVNSTFIDYFPQQEELAVKSKSFLSGKTTGNAKFDALMKDVIKLDMATYATSFLNSPRTTHPALEEYSAYYNGLKAEDFAGNTSGVYRYPWGLRTLSSIILTNLRQRGIKNKSGLEGLKDQLNLVPNDTLKGDIVLETASRYKSFNDYQALKDGFGKYILTTTQKATDMAILTPLAELKPGSTAFNFSYPDKNGKALSMSDLKGKVVLIDVWATWCGPCKAEIPHLKKLEEDLSGKEVAIVSISIDADKDKEKWLKMIADENLGGIQLFAGVKNTLSDYYKITSIPRFMVFDKEGKIVNVDAPRPSQPELKVLLEKMLSK